MLQSNAHMLPFSKLAQLQAEKGGPCLQAIASSCEALSLVNRAGEGLLSWLHAGMRARFSRTYSQKLTLDQALQMHIPEPTPPL